jgi:hypothetical protein
VSIGPSLRLIAFRFGPDRDRPQTKPPTQARRIAANVAKLPELLQKA